jgi:diacylglycerol kinase family enzyme
VIAWGGDGTVNEVASALAFGETALGIVPSGSGNGLARQLGVSSRPGRAIREAMAAAKPPLIDVGELGGHLFFSVAGIGFDAHVAACFDREGSGRRGLPGYVRVLARELLSYRCSTYRVSVRGQTTTRSALHVTFANGGQWGNGVQVAPGAEIDDGRLDLVVFEERSRLATFCALPRAALTGTVARIDGVSIEQVEQATIESEQPMAFHVDGEPRQGGTRLDARIHPRALRVAVR